ncbi:MAG: N-acyl-D-amino-acid deacylase family protein [Gemmatimonadaceae bacterium]
MPDAAVAGEHDVSRSVAGRPQRPASGTFASRGSGSTVLGSVLLAAVMSLAATAAGAQEPAFDILIVGGRVLDGSGNPDFGADIGIRGDRIVALGALRDRAARRVIDARGLYVAPGFIDIHSHADAALASDDSAARGAPNLVTQGITTVVGAPDGRNRLWPVSGEIAAFRNHGMALNIVPMVGHNTVRREVMRDDHEREATAAEVARMRALVRQGMEEGAWGLSAGLEYRPGRFSSADELVEVARAVTPYAGFYIAHQRSESQLPSVWQVPSMVRQWPVDGVRALDETIRIAREAGIAVVGSHIKAQGRSSFGRSAIDVRMVELARAEGLQIYLDQYPWDSYGGGQSTLIPRWALVDDPSRAAGGLDSPALRAPGALARSRQNLRRTLADSVLRRALEQDIAFLIDADGGADRILILDHPDSALIGRTLADAAARLGKSDIGTVIDFALTGYDRLPEGAYFRNRAMDEPDIDHYMRQEYTATSTDAGVDVIRPGDGGGRGLHPRSYGSLPRKISRYVRDRKVISLPFAIRSSTGLPAQIIGLSDRGILREGYRADLVVFDLRRIRERTTYLQPRQFSEGIEYVAVNGQLTMDGGKLTEARPGVVIERGGAAQPRRAVSPVPPSPVPPSPVSPSPVPHSPVSPPPSPLR